MRGKILLVIDFMGKWSLVDVFVIQFISGIVFMDVTGGKLDKLSHSETQGMWLRTETEIGFTAFVLATVCSLVLGHVQLFKHEADPLARLEYARFKRAARRPVELAKLLRGRATLEDIERAIEGSGRYMWRRFTAPLLAVAFGFFFVGCLVPAFTVQLVSPIPGVMKPYVNTYSIWSFAHSLPYFSEQPWNFSTRFSQLTFVFFAIVFVHIHCGVLVLACFVKLTPSWRTKLNTTAHTFYSWASTDVMLVAMVLTLFEMDHSNLAKLKDGPVRDFFSSLAGHPVTTDKMLAIDVTLHAGTYMIVVGVALHTVLGRVVMGKLERAVMRQKADLATFARRPTEAVLELPEFAEIAMILEEMEQQRLEDEQRAASFRDAGLSPQASELEMADASSRSLASQGSRSGMAAPMLEPRPVHPADAYAAAGGLLH